MQLGEGWSLLGLTAPAPKHQLVQTHRTGRGPGQVHLQGRRGRGDRDREPMSFSPNADKTLPIPLPAAPSRPDALTWRPWSRKNSPAFSMTCSSVSCPKGWARQSISTSHRVTPKAHTSLAVVNFPWQCRNKTGKDIDNRDLSPPHKGTSKSSVQPPFPPSLHDPLSLSGPPAPHSLRLAFTLQVHPLPHFFPFSPSFTSFPDFQCSPYYLSCQPAPMCGAHSWLWGREFHHITHAPFCSP